MRDYSYARWREAVLAIASADATGDRHQDRFSWGNNVHAEKILFNLCHRASKADRQVLIRELQRVDE